MRTAAAVFTVLIGALLFGYFLTVTQTPQKVTEFLTGLGLGRYGVLALIMLMYLVLGCLMDALAMIILTMPIIFPVITQLGFDPIWFGVIIVMTVELGLIHPPVGMNVFVIKSVVQDVSFSTIFVGVLPFIVTDLDPAGDPDRVSVIGAVAAVAHVRPAESDFLLKAEIRGARPRFWQSAAAVPVSTARVARSGPKSSTLSIAKRSASLVRARFTRLLIVPTAQPQIAAASSYEKPDAPTRIRASRWSEGSFASAREIR